MLKGRSCGFGLSRARRYKDSTHAEIKWIESGCGAMSAAVNSIYADNALN